MWLRPANMISPCWVRPIGCCDRPADYEPLILCDPPEACKPLALCDVPPYGGPLVNQLIEADRARQVIDTAELQSVCPPDRDDIATVAARESTPPVANLDQPGDTPPPRIVHRTVHEPIYHLGTLLDVLA